MNFHNPNRQVHYLQQCLSSDKKPLGFFIGAGCPMAIRVGKDGKLPLIPDIAGITKMVRDELVKEDPCGPHFEKIQEQLKKDGNSDANVEDILTHIRGLRAVAGKEKVRELSAKELDQLDDKICQIIHKVTDQNLPNNDTPYHKIAKWVDAVRQLEKQFQTNP